MSSRSPTRCCAAGRRLSEALEWTDASPGGAGCVNGTRLRSDRGHVAALLGFRSIAEHTRDAMWQTDGLFDMVGAAAGLVVTQSELAEDLEIWASQEFDYVTLADGYSRASVLMPQEAQSLRAVDHPRRGRDADRPAHRAAGGGQDPVGPQRQPHLRLRGGAAGPRPGAADHRADRGRGPHAHGQLRPHGGTCWKPASRRPPTWPSSSCRTAGWTTGPPTGWSAARCARRARGGCAASTSTATCWTPRRPR